MPAVGIKPANQPWFGTDVMAAIQRVQLFSEFRENSQDLRLMHPISPTRTQAGLRSHDSGGMPDQENEQLEFLIAKAQCLALHRHLLAGQINAEIAALDNLRRLL